MPAANFLDRVCRISPEKRRVHRRGVTLFELCMVLLIMGVLTAVLMPSMTAILVEQTVRRDARELSLMVKTGMVRSGEEHRAYALDLTATTMALHPVGATNAAAVKPLAPTDKIEVPNPKKKDAWIDLPATSWLFQPNDLCPALRVRLARGGAWVEMTFNALTGDTEEEGSYFP